MSKHHPALRCLNLAALCLAVACTKHDHTGGNTSGLFVIRENDKYGFVDKAGKVAIPPQFEIAAGFSEDLAAVAYDGRWGYVDTAGKLAINPQFAAAGHFSHGLAAVRVGHRWGYVDRQGALAINPQFDTAGPFAEGLASVTSGERTGYVDAKGRFAISPQFEAGIDFSEGLAPAMSGRKWGFIDRDGKYAIAPQFEFAWPFRDHLAAVNVMGRWGYVDRSGKLVVNPQFDDAKSFAEGLAVVKTGGRWGFVDSRGKFVVDPQFDDARSFSEGLAAVRAGDLWGFVDKAGKLVIDPQFQEVGLIVVPGYDRWDLIDKVGGGPQLREARTFDDGLCAVYLRSPDNWAYVDRAGKLVWGELTARSDDKAFQRQTVADMRHVAAAMMSWLTDQIGAGAAGQNMLDLGDYRQVTAARLNEILAPSYIQEVPINDGWGHPYEYYLTTDVSQKKIVAIRSAGADGVFSADTYAKGTFDPSNVEEDIVWADGYFVRWPQATSR